jgi:hypothetical protein
MRIENLVEWWLAGETEVLGENLLQCHFFHHKSHMTWPGANPGRRGGKPATNRLNSSTAKPYYILLFPSLWRWKWNAARQCPNVVYPWYRRLPVNCHDMNKRSEEINFNLNKSKTMEAVKPSVISGSPGQPIDPVSVRS